jgi:CTP synthase
MEIMSSPNSTNFCTKTKYIFVTGGVVSGLGKGITSASLGLILKSAGLKVDAIKFDPYLNVDPGTMSPYEHGEVYVLDDGSECDLDLGHYERFLDTNLTSTSSVTAGKIYSTILEDERQGKYLGKNVQLIPNVTNHIKDCFVRNIEGVDVRMIEIGGSAGDMEADIFLESLRQFKLENKKSVIHLHLGYVPFLACSNEYKSKPIQNSIRELLQKGLQPDMLVVRSEATKNRQIPDTIFAKIALFSNLDRTRVVSVPDQESIYSVPALMINSEGVLNLLEELLGQKLDIKLPEFFQNYRKIQFQKTLNVSIIAKYTLLTDAYLSVIESLNLAARANKVNINVNIIDADDENLETIVQESDAIVVTGGFGVRGMEGKIKAFEYSRKKLIPTLGICLGLQMMIIEFARDVCDISNAVSAEMFENRELMKNSTVMVDYMEGQENIQKKGGTMRLGGYNCKIRAKSLASKLFPSCEIRMRHRHRLEVQNQYLDMLELKGLQVTGKFEYVDKQGQEQFLVEIMELDTKIHPYYIANQAHPEFASRPGKPCPFFDNLLKVCLNKN